MKRTLLTLILLVSIAGAQNNIVPKEFEKILGQAQGITKDDDQWLAKARHDVEVMLRPGSQWDTYPTTQQLVAAYRPIRVFLALYSRYEKECTPEWRLEKLLKDSVWIPPLRDDWREVLTVKPTFEGFIIWLRRLK